MFKTLLIAAVVIINLRYGLSVVTMSPSLAKIVPTNLPPLREEYVLCFNKYWDIKEALDLELRQQWNCTNGCAKGLECCISYKVWDSLSGLKLADHCTSGALNMIRMFLPMALNQIQDRCEPDFKHGSDECRDLEVTLPSPKSTEYTCPRKVCACY